MRKDVLLFIRKRPYLYHFLRLDSSYYEMIIKDPNSIYELNRIAKEKLKIRFQDKVDNLSNKINLLHTFLDVFQ